MYLFFFFLTLYLQFIFSVWEVSQQDGNGALVEVDNALQDLGMPGILWCMISFAVLLTVLRGPMDLKMCSIL